MITLLRNEFAKLGGSLALLLAVVAPAMPAVLAALALFSHGRTPSWEDVLAKFLLPIWVMFLLPMTLAAFTTLLAQIEYRPKAWDVVLTQPVARWQIYLAKAIVAAASISLMTVMAIAAAIGLTLAVSFVTGRAPSDELQLDALGLNVLRFLGASACMVMLQLWVALRFPNFVIPLVVGIGGALVALAVVITGTSDADWFPWVLPLRTLAAGPDANPDLPAFAGLAAGAVVLVAMLVHLSRREMR